MPKARPKILIVGCGEHARVVIDNVEDQGAYEIFGLSTHSDAELGTKVCGYPVVCKDDGIPALLKAHPEITGWFLGVGHMKTRLKLYTPLDKLLPAVNVIHPTCVVSKHAQLGKGILLEAYTRVANGARVGDHCIVNTFSAINHDQEIGANVLIAGNVSLAGKRIGSHTIIADGASIGFKRTVGERCIVGDGAVVTKDLPDNVIAYGNPARVVRDNGWE